MMTQTTPFRRRLARLLRHLRDLGDGHHRARRNSLLRRAATMDLPRR